jgi:transposase
MMGRKYREQANFFYEFRLDYMIPKRHLLRRINVFVTSVLGDLREQLGPFYSAIGRPSIDPELLIRMLIVGYCFGIRSERKLCEEVKLHLAYRWFCRLDLNDAIPHHSTFSENRLNRFHESDILRQNADDQTPADPSLLRIIARAHHIQARLIQNPKLSVHDIAREEQVSAAYLYTLLRLPWLAPDITTAIVNGRKPPQLTAQTLMRLTPRLPANWAEQRKLLGFR